MSLALSAKVSLRSSICSCHSFILSQSVSFLSLSAAIMALRDTICLFMFSSSSFPYSCSFVISHTLSILSFSLSYSRSSFFIFLSCSSISFCKSLSWLPNIDERMVATACNAISTHPIGPNAAFMATPIAVAAAAHSFNCNWNITACTIKSPIVPTMFNNLILVLSVSSPIVSRIDTMLPIACFPIFLICSNASCIFDRLALALSNFFRSFSSKDIVDLLLFIKDSFKVICCLRSEMDRLNKALFFSRKSIPTASLFIEPFFNSIMVFMADISFSNEIFCFSLLRISILRKSSVLPCSLSFFISLYDVIKESNGLLLESCSSILL